MRINILIVLFLYISVQVVGAPYEPKQPNPLFENWRWKTFTELSDKGVRCVVEGQDQSMWFGTGKGVFHYDGINWTQYATESEVLNSPIYGIYRSTNNHIYAASTKGVCHFVNGQWVTDVMFPEDFVLGEEWEILNFEETDDGRIFIGVYFGLFEIDQDNITLYTTKDQLKDIDLSSQNIDIRYMDDIFDQVERFIVYDILQDRAKDLWLALEDGRTLKIEAGNELTTPGNYRLYSAQDGMNLSRLPILFESQDGTLYHFSQSIGGSLNSYIAYEDKWSSIRLSEQFGGDNLYFSMMETDEGSLWIGGLQRIFVRKNNTWHEYKQPELEVPQTRIILKPTNDGSIWIAGLLSEVIRVQYQTSQWNTYQGLNYQCQDKNGIKWFLNGAGELVTFNEHENSWNRLDKQETPIDAALRIFIDQNERMWVIGSHEGAAALAYEQGSTWEVKKFPEICWSFHPNGVFQASDQKIWFGPNPDCGDEAKWGLVSYDPVKGNPGASDAWERHPGTEICEVAYALGETAYNTLLCGYYKGLYEDMGDSTRALHKTLLNDIVKIEDMDQDLGQGIWIGTRSHGVIHYINDEEWTQYTLEEGIASNSVSSVLVASDSTVWVATDKGVSRFDGKNWIQYALPTHFTLSIGKGSIMESPDGSIWFNMNALSWYRRVYYNNSFTEGNSPLITYRIKPEDEAPETKILRYDEKVYYPGNTIVFWNGLDQWNATAVKDLQFSYRLDGGEWSDFTSATNQSFLNLKRGDHVLEVRARDKFFNIDPSPSQVRFEVIQPVWGQVWFILLVSGLVITIVYLMISTMRKNKEVQARNLEMNKKNDDLVKQQKEIEEKSDQIMQLMEAEKETKWMNEGLLLVGDIVKKHKDNIETLAQQLVMGLVEYLKINYAAVFTRTPDDYKKLELKGGFNINQEIKENKNFFANEGLTGTCYADKETMVIDDLPSHYFGSSGLGEDKFKSLALIPVKIHDDIVGVFEIASFNTIEPKAIELLEAASENIASNIIGLEAKEKIEEMYNKSVEQASQLHEQDEELRQNIEEMRSTQEEVERKMKQNEKMQEEMKYETTLLELIFENLSDSIYLKDLDSKYLRVSQSMAQAMGVSNNEDLIGKSDFDFYDQEVARTKYDEEQRIIKTKKGVVDHVEHIVLENGTKKWFSTVKLPFIDKEGKVIGIFGISKDITQQKNS